MLMGILFFILVWLFYHLEALGSKVSCSFDSFMVSFSDIRLRADELDLFDWFLEDLDLVISCMEEG